MTAWHHKPWVLLILRIGLGVVFLIAGFLKLGDVQAFADSIATFKLLPSPFINILALSLPPLEIMLGILLVSGWKRRPAALGVFILVGIFILALLQAKIRGLSVNCGCFGSEAPSTLNEWVSFGRDILILLTAFWLYRSFLLSLSRSEK